MANPDKIGDGLKLFVEDSQALDIATDVDAQQRANREKQLAQWSEALASTTAAQLGVTLTVEHLRVVQVLRDHYRDHGEATDGRELEALLERAFAAQGGKAYLHQLFPKGPVNQGMRIAQLPVPPHSVDPSFGTAR